MKTISFITKKLLTYLLLSFALILFSCSGEDGLDGETGPAGKDGNANVITSDWMPIVWTWKDLQEGKSFMDIPIEDMSTYLDNEGIIMMFFKNYNYAYPLPVNLTDSAYLKFNYGKYSANENFQSEAFEGLRFYYEGNPNNINIFQFDSENIKIRYVLVPANIAETTGLSMDSKTNFEETMELLGIDPNQ